MTDPKKEIHDEGWQQLNGCYGKFSPEINRFQLYIDLVIKVRPNVVLDMGCGPGYFAYLLKQNNPEITVHGLDMSKSALDRAKLLFSEWLIFEAVKM